MIHFLCSSIVEHRNERLLLKEILLLASRASVRGCKGKHIQTVMKCCRQMWNTIWLGWISPYEFGESSTHITAEKEGKTFKANAVPQNVAGNYR